MSERDKHLLFRIIDEAEYLLEKTEGHNLDDFIEDKDLQNIVTMTLIKVGE